MDFVNFVMALSPILVVLVGILGFKQSAKRVSPIALVWTLILAFTYFNVTGASFADNVKTLDPLVWKGIKEGLKIVLMVFGAFTILNLLRETGAIDDVKSTIARISDDRRVQLIVIGMMLPIFLEGAAGAGAPAAIAAPFLVALGFDPVTSIAVALLGDATPASWGGAGLTTINGGAALVDAGVSTVALNSAMVGRFHMFGVLVIPFLMVWMAYGKKGFKGIVPYLKQFEADERDMTKFVIGTISDLDAPLLPPYKGIRADAAWFTGVTDAMIQKERDEILAVTPEDIRELAPIIRAVLSEQSICAIGNAEKVKANQDLFKTVKNLFN